MIKKTFSNKKILPIIIFFIFILLAFLYFSNEFEIGNSKYRTNKLSIENRTNKYINVNDKLSEIRVLISNDKCQTNANSYLTLTDQNGNLVYEDTINFKEFAYNCSYLINLKKVKNIKPDQYKFSINSNDSSIKKYNVEFKYLNTEKNFLFYIMFFSMTFIFTILFIFSSKIKVKIHILFLIIAFPIFMAYTIFIPTFMGHDEMYHWVRVFEISELKMIPSVKYNYSGSI